MKWVKIISQILFVVGLIFLLGFTNQRHSEKRCVDYRIELADENISLITRGEIILLMESIQDTIVGKLVNAIPIFDIERKIEGLKNVKNAEVFIDMEGMLHVEVNQKKAVVRVSPEGSEDFYMDANGSMFSLSTNYTEHLLIANGNIEDSVDFSNALILANYISSDSLWQSQIVQIYFKENKEIELIPRVGNHTILLGDVENYKDKFRKLYLFYEHGVNQVGWNNYKEINLKFRNQIVCVKR
jgi:cell division protein FtsQ